jgi:hypothetical protein
MTTTCPPHCLLQVVVNSMLYATSSGAEPEARAGGPRPAATARRQGKPRVHLWERFYLPGAITSAKCANSRSWRALAK